MANHNAALPFLSLAALLCALPLAGCGTEDGPDVDAAWSVLVTGVTTDCVIEDEGFAENMVYQLAYNGSVASLMIDGDTFASGTLNGCEISYQSQVVGEPDRDGGALQWVLSGQAVQRPGGDVCNMADSVEDMRQLAGLSQEQWGAYDYLDGNEAEAVDWVGVETFEIVASEDPDVPEGCTYTLFVAGKYQQDG